MINRASDRPDRQKSNFYWPDEYLQDSQETYRTSSNGGSRRQSTASSSAATTPRECVTPSGVPEKAAEVLQQRHRKNVRSHIEFHDQDDCDSSFSQLERERQRERLRIEKFLREQNDDVSEAAKARRQSTLKSKIQFYDFAEPLNGSTPSKATNGLHHSAAVTPEQEDPSRFSPLSNGGVSLRRQQSSPASSEYHYNARYTGSYDDFEDDRFSYRSCGDFSPPGTPSAGEVPEHKRLSQRHLRSSIAFCNGVAIAEDISESRKPVSVRDSAATQRVGVGLPNL